MWEKVLEVGQAAKSGREGRGWKGKKKGVVGVAAMTDGGGQTWAALLLCRGEGGVLMPEKNVGGTGRCEGRNPSTKEGKISKVRGKELVRTERK